MFTTVQLYQEGGVSGPKGTLELDSLEGSAPIDAASAWADGQAGHPWDGMLVNVYEDESCRSMLDTFQFEYRDGSLEAV